MCEIQFIKNLDGRLELNHIRDFFKLMILGSEHNRDAFGLISKNYSIKSPGEFNSYTLDWKRLSSSNFLIGHNRWATNQFSNMAYNMQEDMPIIPLPYGINILNPLSVGYGTYYYFKHKDKFMDNKNNKADKSSNQKKDIIAYNSNLNNHPFRIDDFLLVHNGVILNHHKVKAKFKIGEHDSVQNSNQITTDSYDIIFLIDKFFKQSLKAKRQNKIVDAIKKTMKELTGTFSVFLYDSFEDKTYYFKTLGTTFTFQLINDSVLIGSTSYNSLSCVIPFKDKAINKTEDIFIDENNIYIVTSDKNCPLKNIGNFEEEFENMFSKISKATKVCKKCKVSKLNSSKNRKERFKYLNWLFDS